MSVYRKFSLNSWSESQKDIKIRKKWIYQGISLLKEIGSYLEEKYLVYILRAIEMNYFSIISDDNYSLEQRILFYKKHRNEFSIKNKIKWHFIYSKPIIRWILRRIKRVIQVYKKSFK